MECITDEKIELILDIYFFIFFFCIYCISWIPLLINGMYHGWADMHPQLHGHGKDKKKKKKTFLNIVCKYISIWNIKRLVTPFKEHISFGAVEKKKEFATTLKGHVTFETLTHMYLLCCVKILIHICMDYGQFNNYVHV